MRLDELAEYQNLLAHMTEAERQELAALLESVPNEIGQGFAAVAEYQRREILKGRLTGQPSPWEGILQGVKRELEKQGKVFDVDRHLNLWA